MTTRALAVAAALALAAGAARAEDGRPARKVKIGLERLRAVGVSPALAEAVEERVCAALAQVSGADVVCPSDVAAAALLAKNAAVFGECATDECIRRVEALAAADRRVSGAIEKGEKGLVLSLQLTDPSGPGPRTVERVPEDLDAIAARIPGIVKKLFP